MCVHTCAHTHTGNVSAVEKGGGIHERLYHEKMTSASNVTSPCNLFLHSPARDQWHYSKRSAVDHTLGHYLDVHFIITYLYSQVEGTSTEKCCLRSGSHDGNP